MIPNRKELYLDLENRIGDTPLVRYTGDVPNNNKILIKRECDNPYGSHYDRVYLGLFREFEEIGLIKPGDKVLETTSGSAGVSFAGIGRELGYECIVAIPEGGEKAREDAILEQRAKLLFTSKERYVAGFPMFVKKYLAKNRDVVFLNHSMGIYDREKKETLNNEITLQALGEIALEIIDSRIKIDYFVPAIGNGSSVLGPGRVIKKFNPGSKIVGFETYQSQYVYELLHGSKYNGEIFDQKRHRLPGTSFKGIDSPHIKNSISDSIIDDVVLVTDVDSIREHPASINFPRWDLLNYEDLGRTGNAALSVINHLINSQNISNSTFLMIAYDKNTRYDN